MANPTDIFDTAEGTPISASQAVTVALLGESESSAVGAACRNSSHPRSAALALR